jgi:hypothetical protein
MTLWEDHRDPTARLPMFLLQMFVVLVVTRFLGWAIKRLYQPKVRAGVLAGVAVVCVSGLGTPSREVCPVGAMGRVPHHHGTPTVRCVRLPKPGLAPVDRADCSASSGIFCAQHRLVCEMGWLWVVGGQLGGVVSAKVWGTWVLGVRFPSGF